MLKRAVELPLLPGAANRAVKLVTVKAEKSEKSGLDELDKLEKGKEEDVQLEKGKVEQEGEDQKRSLPPPDRGISIE